MLPYFPIVYVEAHDRRTEIPSRRIENRKVFVRVFGRVQVSIRADRFDAVTGKTVTRSLELVRRALAPGHVRNPRRVENGGLAAEEIVAEAVELSPGDAVLGGLECRAQCRNVVYILVDTVLQGQEMVAGARAQFPLREPVLLLTSFVPGKARQRCAEYGGCDAQRIRAPPPYRAYIPRRSARAKDVRKALELIS